MERKGGKPKDYLLLNFGVLLNVVGIYFFKFPNHFSTGGISGLAIVLGDYIHFLSPATMMTILNVTLLIIGFLIFGKNFGLRTAYASVLMSGLTQLLEWVCPMDKPFTDQPLLELFFGMMLPAVGAAILFNINASTGGTDIVAMILRKYSHINIGKALMLSDLVITLMGAATFGIETGLFSILGLIIKSFLVDYVIESINMCKYFTIICTHPEEICQYITGELKRSATVAEAKGAYTHQPRYIVLTAIRRYQAVQLRQRVKEIDPSAFLMITNTSEIIGKGFRGLN